MKYLSKEDLRKSPYREQLEKVSNSESNAYLMVEFTKCGGIQEDILEYLCQHDIKSKEYVEIIKPLISDNAEKCWYELVFFVIEEKPEQSISYWINEVIECYRSKISCEDTVQLMEQCKTPHQMAVLRKKLIGKETEDSYKEVMETINGVSFVVENLEKEEQEKNQHIGEVEVKLIELNKKIIEKDQEIQQLKEELMKQRCDGDSKLPKELEYYKNCYLGKMEENKALKAQLSNLRFEFAKEKEKNHSNTENIVSEGLMGYVQKLFKETCNLKEEIRLLKEENKEPPEKLINYIATCFSNQEKYIDEKLLVNIMKNEAEDSQKIFQNNQEEEYVKLTDEYESQYESVEDDVNEPVDKGEFIEDDIEESNFNKDEWQQEEIVESRKTEKQPELKPGNFETRIDRKEVKRTIVFFENVRKKYLLKKFRKMNERDQKSTIISLAMSHKCKVEFVKQLKKALKNNNVSNEFLYELMLDKNLSVEEIKAILSEDYEVLA